MTISVRSAVRYFGLDVEIKTISATSYTVQPDDIRKVLWFTSNSPVTVTLDDFSNIPTYGGFSCKIIQAADGVVTVTIPGADTSVTDLRNTITNGVATGIDLLKQDNTTWWIVAIGDSPFNGVLDTKDATVDPTVNDDETQGYSEGSRWYNQSTSEIFECMDPTTGAAVWVTTSLTLDDLGSAALSSTSDFATAAQGTLADSATQPGDNISTLTNDAAFIDAAGAPVQSVAGRSGDVTLVKADITDFSDGDYATAAQGTTADSALQPNAPATQISETTDGDVQTAIDNLRVADANDEVLTWMGL